MGIGDDVALGIDNDTGAEFALAANYGCLPPLAILDWPKSGDVHFDNGWRHLRHQGLQGNAELLQKIGLDARTSSFLPIELGRVSDRAVRRCCLRESLSRE